MTGAAKAIRSGVTPDAALAACQAEVVAAGYDRVEYIELRDAASLDAPLGLDRPLRLLAAAWVGDVRLIDNIPV